MGIFTRNEDGRLVMQSLELQILLGDMFSVAKDEGEVEWILENIQGYAEVISEEKLEELD